jgi:hypothetical protein
MSSEYLNFTGNLATTKSNLVTQGAVVIVKEVNEAIKQLARAYNNKTSKIFTLVESYKNEYDIFDELIPRVKHLSYQNAYGAWPETKAIDLIEYDSADDTTIYEDAKTAINLIPYNKFKPPLIQPQITKGFPNTALYREIPQKFTDVRQTGRYVKVTSQTVSADLDWFITNACLYGFVVYGNDALYYVGRSYLESIVDDQEVHTKVLYAFIPDKAVALPPPPPPPPPVVNTGGTGTGGTPTGGTGTAGAGAAGTSRITPTPKTVTKTNYTNNTPTTGKTFAYANNPNISALRNEIIHFAKECAALKPKIAIPFLFGFTDNNNKDPGPPDAPTTLFEQVITATGFKRSPYINPYGALYWNNDKANPSVYINIINTQNTVKNNVVTKLIPDITKNYDPKIYKQATVGQTVSLVYPQHYCNYTTNAFWFVGYQRYTKNSNITSGAYYTFWKNNLKFATTATTYETTRNAMAANLGVIYANVGVTEKKPKGEWGDYISKIKPRNLLTDLEPGDMVTVRVGAHIVLCTEVSPDGTGFKYIGGNEGGTTNNRLNSGTYPIAEVYSIVKLPNYLAPNDPKNKPFIF